jgi:hypothetical protein
VTLGANDKLEATFHPLPVPRIDDGHAPIPGPMYWDFKCLVCDGSVDRHPNLIHRFRIRRANRRSGGPQ